MFTLIGLGTGAAYLFSVVALLAPGIFPPTFRNADGSVPVYFEAAAVITALVLMGQVLELGARSRTGRALKALMGLAPKTAIRVKPGWRRRGGCSRGRSGRRCAADSAGREDPG